METTSDSLATFQPILTQTNPTKTLLLLPPPLSFSRIGSGTSVLTDSETGIQADSRSKYKGVSLLPSGRWCAKIYNPKKQKCQWLGTFNELHEAVQAYDNAVQRFRGMCMGMTISNINGHLLFEKVVCASDVRKPGMLVIPKRQAERHFPLLRNANCILLEFEDVDGKVWSFEYSFLASSCGAKVSIKKTYRFRKDWGDFVKDKNLKAGDTIFFYKSTSFD